MTSQHQREEITLGSLLVMIGALPMLSAVLHGDTWGTEPSLGMLMVLFGGYHLVEALCRAHASRSRRR